MVKPWVATYGRKSVPAAIRGHLIKFWTAEHFDSYKASTGDHDSLFGRLDIIACNTGFTQIAVTRLVFLIQLWFKKLFLQPELI
jgi:hypothetical protein